MDTLTHAALGALLARAGQPPQTPAQSRWWLAAGACAAAFPDIDYASFWLDPYRFHTEWHRGPTHSLLILPLWAWLLALLFRRLARAERLRPWFGLAALGLASHAGTDLLTVYGTQLLFPLDDARYSLGISFVVDPYFSAIVLAGLAVSYRLRQAAWLGLSGLAAYLYFQAGLRGEALAVAAAERTRLNWAEAREGAYPQPLSPYHWLITVGDERRWRWARVRLRQEAPVWLGRVPALETLDTSFLPPEARPWREATRFGTTEIANELWQHSKLDGFRRFAYEPRLYRLDRDGSGICVWYSDAAFELPGQIPPFRYGLCRAEEGGGWRRWRLRLWTEGDREALPE